MLEISGDDNLRINRHDNHSLNDLAPPAKPNEENTPFRAYETWSTWEKTAGTFTYPTWDSLPAFLFEKGGLSASAERELLFKVRKGGPEGDEAKNLLLESNLKLVRFFAQRYSSLSTPGVDVEDLFQEGTLGLKRAIELFDPERPTNYRLSTYAGAHIWAAIHRAVNYTSDTVHYPERFRRAAWCSLYAAQDLTHTLGRDPTYGEVARRVSETHASLKIDASTISDLFAMGILQDHPPIENTFTEYCPSLLPADENVSESIARADILASVNELVHQHSAQLPPRQREILALRFPLDPDQDPKTLEEIGDIYGISKQRVSQMEIKIFDRLRKRLEARGLRPETL